MHLRARMVEGRNAEKYVVVRLCVVRLLGAASVQQRAMGMQNGFRKARCSRGEVDCRVVVFRKRTQRKTAGAFVHQFRQIIRKSGAAGA